MEKKINHKNSKYAIWLLFEPFLFYYAGYIGCFFVIKVMEDALNRGTLTTGSINAVCIMAGGICLLPLLLKQEVYKSRELVKGWKAVRAFTATALLAFSSALLLNYFLNLFQTIDKAIAYQKAERSLYAVPYWLGIFTYVMVAPIVEETLFRFLLFHRIEKIMRNNKSMTNLVTAMVGSSLLFGIYHGNVIQGSYAFILGIMLSGIYVLTGRFLFTVFFHAICNLTVYTLSYHDLVYQELTTPVWLIMDSIIILFILYLTFQQIKI